MIHNRILATSQVHPLNRPTRSPGASGQAGRVRAWQQYQATELASESGPVGQGRDRWVGFCPEFQPGDPARVGIVGLNLLKWGIMFKILPVPVTQPVRHWPWCATAPWQARQAWQGWNHDCLKMYCRDSLAVQVQRLSSVPAFTTRYGPL